MATFYVLPPRECLELAVAEFVARLLPGVPATAAIDHLGSLLRQEAEPVDAYFVHREDLTGAAVDQELTDGFGAEAGDRVVEFGLASTGRTAAVRSWVVASAVPVVESA